MKKIFGFALLFVLAATTAFAHAGHAHTYMGTVTMLHTKTQFMIRTTEGKDVTINTSPKTAWSHADGHVAKVTELEVGTRVVVKMNVDGKTAASIRMSAPAKK